MRVRRTRHHRREMPGAFRFGQVAGHIPLSVACRIQTLAVISKDETRSRAQLGRQTGKVYRLRNTSYSAHVISGARPRWPVPPLPVSGRRHEPAVAGSKKRRRRIEAKVAPEGHLVSSTTHSRRVITASLNKRRWITALQVRVTLIRHVPHVQDGHGTHLQ